MAVKKPTTMADDLAKLDGINESPNEDAYGGDKVTVPMGYYRLDKKELCGGGAFYPETMELYYRAASVEEVSNWSNMDDKNPQEVYDGVVGIVRSCVKGFPWKMIKEADRLKILMYVHEITFANTGNTMSVRCTCASCDTKYDKKILARDLCYKEIDKRLLDRVEPETGELLFQTKDFGEIRMAVPSLGSLRIVTDYMATRDKAWLKDHMMFFKIASFLILDHRVDGKKTMNTLYKDYSNWDIDKLGFMINLHRELSVGIEDVIPTTCPSCGEHNNVDIEGVFKGGMRNIFIKGVPDIYNRLL